MNEYDATEAAYNNGYDKGWNDAIDTLSERVKRYYSNLKGDTVCVSVGYNVRIIAAEMRRSNDS